MTNSKSYWMPLSVRTADDKEAVKSHFMGMLDNAEVLSARVLICKTTDREKKLEVAVREDGRVMVATLNNTRRGGTITYKPGSDA